MFFEPPSVAQWLSATTAPTLDEEHDLLAVMALTLAAKANEDSNDFQLQIRALQILSVALPDVEGYELETCVNDAFAGMRNRLLAPVEEQA